MSPLQACPQPGLPLPDELVEEVLARLPPDDPAHLVRTALVCKGWCRLLCGPGFRRRFRQFHRTPPLLGYIHIHNCCSYFVPTSSFRPLHAPRLMWSVINARHGRVLVVAQRAGKEFIVWDPATDEQRRLPVPPFKYAYWSWNAALLCAAVNCDHSNCPWGPFLVVFVCADGDGDDKGMVFVSVYSSEEGAWREPISIHQHGHCGVCMRGPNALVRNAIYFGCGIKVGILEYDLGKQELSMIRLPPLCYWQHFALMTAENGGLGFTNVQEKKLCFWSTVVDLGGHATWAQQRVIELDPLLPIHAFPTPYVYTIAVDDHVGVVVIWAANILFTFDLRSSRVEEVGNNVGYAFGVVPYMNFCTPVVRSQEHTSMHAMPGTASELA